MKRQHERVLIWALIEDPEAIANVEEIAAVRPGADLIGVGRGDLSVALGLPGQIDHPTAIEATERVIQQVTDRSQGQCGLSVMVHGPHEIAPWFERGCRMFTYAADAVMLMNVARDAVEQFKNLLNSGHVRRSRLLVWRGEAREEIVAVIAQGQGREGRGRRAAACVRRWRPRPRPSRRRFRGSSQCRQGRSSSSPSGRAPAAIPSARCRRGS